MARLNASLHPKLTDSIISIFESKKIYTVFDFMAEDSEKIMQFSGLTYQDILDVKQRIGKLYIGGIKKGSELLKTNYNNITRTEINSLDNLLKGGLRGGEIYEICGLPSSGKSQISHTLAINIASCEKSNGFVHYIDSKGDFSAKRAHTIIKSKKFNEDQQVIILDKIIVTKIEESRELMDFLYSLINKEGDQSNNNNKLIKLIIIDSLTTLFFNCEIVESSGSYNVHNSCLNNFSNILRCVANELNIPIITINLISEWRDYFLEIKNCAESSSNSITRKPGLGKYWYSVPNTRLFIETMKNQDRKITVWKSSCLFSGASCLVKITNSGIE